MEGDRCSTSFFQRCKPYIAMICLQFGFAGMNIITKVSLNRGMSHYVLVVYRHAFATAVIAPFAIVLERKIRPRITFLMFMQMFVLGLLGPVIDQNLYYAGLKFTSPTYSCAISNILPAMTFVMAVIFRMEKLDIKKLRCQVKVIGTVITVAGAMVMTLYKGQVINILSSQYMHHPRNYEPENTTDSGEKDWVEGSILLIIATFAWASFFILQAVTLRKYSAQLSLTAIVCSLGTLQSIAVTFVMEHKPNAWSIGWDMNLLAAAYAGIISSGLTYYVQGIVMQKKGPVFVTAFSPLMMIIVAIMGTFILAEKLYLGGETMNGGWIRYARKICYCQNVAVISVSMTVENPNRLFYRCKHKPEDSCKFFRWCEPIGCEKETMEPVDVDEELDCVLLDQAAKFEGMRKELEGQLVEMKKELEGQLVEMKKLMEVEIENVKKDSEMEISTMKNKLEAQVKLAQEENKEHMLEVEKNLEMEIANFKNIAMVEIVAVKKSQVEEVSLLKEEVGRARSSLCKLKVVVLMMMFMLGWLAFIKN